MARAEFLLDSDVLIWHLRGRLPAVELVLSLARRGRLALSAIARAEIVLGMRDSEKTSTLLFLNSCETFPVTAEAADLAGEIIRDFRRQGVTLDLADTLIGATALIESLPLFTCNPRHYPMVGLDLRPVAPPQR